MAGHIGKTDNGVVSVSSLWADERVYYPVHFEPYTPAHHFERGKNDPEFRTKLKIACQLVERSVAVGLRFRAVVADSFYGEDREFKRSLGELGVGYVLSLKKSHSWWHREGTIGALWEAAEAAGWKGAEESGGWTKVMRNFRDGHREDWWALEVEAGPYGKERAQRALVISTDPGKLPDLATWYLTTNLPAPCRRNERENEGGLAPASAEEVVRLYGLRMWVEQSYKQVKHALGWSQYQVRSDVAIRRHWQLVCCAFSFCWWAYGRLPTDEPTQPENEAVPVQTAGKGKKEDSEVLAGGFEGGKGVAGAVGNALVILEGVLRDAPTSGAESAA